MLEEKEIDIFYILWRTLDIIKKGKFFIIVCVIIFIIIGFFNYFISRDNYKISFTGSSLIMRTELVFEIINDLQKNIDENNKTALDAKLNLKNGEFDKIKSIKIDTLPHSNLLRISINTNDSSYLVYFKQKLNHYFNNLNFVKKLQLEYITSNQKLLNELNRKVKQLDSLQEMMLNPTNTFNRIMPVSPYYTEYIEIIEKKLSTEGTLNEIMKGNVIIEYTQNIVEITNRFTRKILLYSLIGLFGSILLLLFKAFYKKINSYSKN